MANGDLQKGSAPANAKLASELEALHERVQRMEQLLRGIEATLVAVTHNDMIAFTPAKDENTDKHRHGLELLEFATVQLSAWRKSEADLDFASDDIWDLWERAKDGRLLRYGKSVLEPVE